MKKHYPNKPALIPQLGKSNNVKSQLIEVLNQLQTPPSPNQPSKIHHRSSICSFEASPLILPNCLRLLFFLPSSPSLTILYLPLHTATTDSCFDCPQFSKTCSLFLKNPPRETYIYRLHSPQTPQLINSLVCILNPIF